MLRDALGLVGLGSIAAGLWMVAPWIALVVIGTIILALAIVSQLRHGAGGS